jgi:FkbM family methyltransferase
VSRFFVSNAQNHEDVVLWRALRQVPNGRYVEVGANDPRLDSVTRAFYDRGWRGITVEPMHDFAERHRAQRPDDQLVEAAISSTPGEITLHQFPNSGLSTTIDAISDTHRLAGLEPDEVRVPTRRLDDVLESAGWADTDIHFMTVDVEGAEADVLSTIDLKVWRPWILVIEAAAPEVMLIVDGPVTPHVSHEDWEDLVLSAGYAFCLFDGVSRFYVAQEHADSLGPFLTYPTCVLDNFVSAELHNAHADLDETREALVAMTDDATYWRSMALSRWADTLVGQLANGGEDAQALRSELDAIRNTVSWRVTAPLRAARKVPRPGNPAS